MGVNREPSLGFRKKKETDFREMVSAQVQPLHQMALMSAMIQQNYIEKGFSTIAKSSIQSVTDSNFQINPQIAIKRLFNVKDQDLQHQINKNYQGITQQQEQESNPQKIGNVELKFSMHKQNHKDIIQTPINISSEYLSNEILKKHLQKDQKKSLKIIEYQNEQDQRLTYQTDISQNRTFQNQSIKNDNKKDDLLGNSGNTGIKKVQRVKNSLGRVLMRKQNIVETEAKMSMNLMKSQFKVENFVHQMKYKQVNTQSQLTIAHKVDATSRTMMTNYVDYSSIQNIPTDSKPHSNRNFNLLFNKLQDIERDSSIINENQLNISDNMKDSQILVEQKSLNNISLLDKSSLQNMEVQSSQDVITNQALENLYQIQRIDQLGTAIKKHSIYSSADRIKIDDKFSQFIYGSQIYKTNVEDEEGNQNEKLQQVYQNMDRITQNHGYAKSPDFYYQREFLQRQKINQWLKSRGKTSLQSQKAYQFKNQLSSTNFNANNKILIRNHMNFIKVEDPQQKLNILQKNDYEIYLDKDLEKTNQHLSMDLQNQEIMQFCTFLFLSWMEDYKYYADLQKDQNMTHHLFSMNEGLQINISENCLPIDYFMERMFQIGLCTSIFSMKNIIDDMLQNDNAGFTKKIRDNNDSFEPMNFHSKESIKFIKDNLDKNLFKKTDRISINQFLNLFNVLGVGNSKKIDKFLDILKAYSAQQRQQTTKKSKNQNIHDLQSEKKRKNLWVKIKDSQIQLIQQQNLEQEQEYLNKIKEQASPFQRKIAGLVSQNLDKQSIYKYMQSQRPNSHGNIRSLQFNDQGIELTQCMHLEQSKADLSNASHKPKLRSLSPSLNINNQNLDFFNISQDERFYENVMKQLKNISNISEFIKESQKLHVDNTYQECHDEYNMLINNGSLINPRVILEAIQGKNKDVINQKKRNFLALFSENIKQSTIVRNNSQNINQQDQQNNQLSGINISNFLKENNQMLEVKEEQESSISGNKSAKKNESIFEDIKQKTKKPKLIKQAQISRNSFDVEQATNSFDFERNEDQNESPRKQFTVKRAIKLIKQQSSDFNSPRKSSQNNSPTLQLRSSQKKRNKLQRKLSLVKKYPLDPEEAKYLKEKHQMQNLKKQIEEHSNEQMQELKKIENGIDTIRKQLILLEICNDLIQIQQILGGLLTYDSTNAITTKYNNQKLLSNQNLTNDKHQIKIKLSSSAKKLKSKVYNSTFYKNMARNNQTKLEFEKFSRTFSDLQILEKRQYFRKQFHEFVIIKMKEKYSQQMNLLYSNEEYKLGKNLFKGASVEMTKDPFDYGIQARSHLIKIASLMIQNKVYLDTQNFVNLCKFQNKIDNLDHKYPGILGWLVELSQHEEIRKELGKLVNLVIQQIKDREATFSYPNEDIEDILTYGEKIWSTQIDIKNNLIIKRHVLDQYLLQNKVVKDYKEVNRFIAGVLNGQTVNVHEEMKKSQFMKIVNKAAMRESVKNIIAFNQFGMDTRMINISGQSRDYQTIPISLQILRLQRLILYSGIKTKNSNGLPIVDRKDYLERSISCSNIISNLQKLKQNSNIDSADGCKIILQKYNEQFQKFKHKQLVKNQVYESLDPTKEWQAIHKNDDCYKFENDQSVEQHIKEIENLGYEDKLQQEEINEFQKNIYRRLTAENEEELKSKMHGNHFHTSLSNSSAHSQLNQITIQKTKIIGQSIQIKKSPLDLPQVKQALKVQFDNENGEIAKMVHQNVRNLNHHANKFSFGNPQKYFLHKNKNSIQNKQMENMEQNNDDIKFEINDFNENHKRKQDKIEAKIQRLYELGENDKQINERISLVQRQKYRSAFSREMLKKAVYKNY